MAISEQKQGNNVYIIYSYRDGDKRVSIYCGKKGLTATEKKLKAAKRKHYDARLKIMQKRFWLDHQ